MAYDNILAARLEKLITRKFCKSGTLKETRIFGGFGYMLNGNMCMGILNTTLMIRVGVETANTLLKEPHVRPMDLTGKIMKGWAMLEPKAISKDQDMERYCRLSVEFVKTLPKK